MYISNIALAALAASAVNAASFSEHKASALDFVKRGYASLNTLTERDGGAKCPAVWNKIASELTTMFLDTTKNPSECNDDARAAIREAFHDCGAWQIGAPGGCDGSLILSTGPNSELGRGENNGLQDISGKLLVLQQKYVKIDPSVTVADVIQFANAVALTACPGGPQIKTFVGRPDSSVPAPNGLLPDVHAKAVDLRSLFAKKGISDSELAALLGAHSTSKQYHIPGAPEGAGQDSTPGKWDVKYYADTLKPPPGVYVFPSDSALAADPTFGKQFKGFVGSQGKWTSAFSQAMTKMSLFGVPSSAKLIDCTNSVPRGTNNKREFRAAPINDRVY